MKEGWKYKKLGDICRRGKNIKWDDQTNDTSFKYIDLTSVDRNDLCIHNPHIITKNNAPSRAKQIIQAGDIIFATTRPTLRRVSLIDEQYDGDICSTGFCVLRPIKEVKSKIIFYALLKDSFYKYIEPLQTGANYPAVTDSIVKNYIIPVPPLSEQQSIVDYLDSAFAKIDAMMANAEKSLNETKALFQASLKEMLEPKEGWKEKIIDDIVFFRNGIAHEKEIDNGGKYVVINSKFVSTNGRVRKYTNEQLSPLYNNEIVMVMSDVPKGKTLAKCYIIECDNKYSLNQRICAFKSKGLDIKFLYYLLNRNPHLLKYDNGENQTNLRKKQILECPVSYPPQMDEQQSIVDTLDALKSKVDRLQENYEKITQECDALKQAILRQVFE